MARLLAQVSDAHFETISRCCPGSRRSARRSRWPSSTRRNTGAGPSCSSMRCTASTRASRMPSCPMWKTAR
ncbi:hypothetical protein N5K55_20540 [Pseudomonas aeruginosa]|nr:hypothetical protein [Pseudomonas aeruginosa]